MKKIKFINTTRMTNNEHFQLHGNFINGVKNYGGEVQLKILPEMWTLYNSQYKTLDEAQKKIKKSILTTDINAFDAERDKMFTGINEVCKAMTLHPDPLVARAAKELLIIIKTYGNINRMSFIAQTAAVKNLVGDLRKKYADQMDLLDLDVWVKEMEKANNNVDNLMNERSKQSSQQIDIPLKEARNNIDETYRSIVDRINSLIVVEGEANYLEFAKFWNERLEKFKILVNN